MNEKKMEIFSIKTNLIAHCKGISFNLNNNNQPKTQTNQHNRVKSVCFSSMINTIRGSTIIKDRSKEKQKQAAQPEKENTGLAIQANKCKPTYTYEAALVPEVPRGSILHSRSFLIRPYQNRKQIIGSSEVKKINKVENICKSFEVNFRNYNMESTITLCSKIKIFRESEMINEMACLSIIICGYLLNQRKASKIPLQIEHLENPEINIFALCINKQQAKSMSEKYKNLTILYIEGDEHRKQYQNDGLHQYFFYCTQELQEKLGKKLIVLHGSLSLNSNWRFFPYFGLDQPEKTGMINGEQENKSQSPGLAYFTVNSLIAIKKFQIENDRVFIRLNSSKKLVTKDLEYSLKPVLQIHLQKKANKTIQRKKQHPSMQLLQEKLIEYCKIIKREKQESCEIDKRSFKLAVNNKMRKSLASKSSYQIVNELIRNNIQIAKQISAYSNSFNYIPLPEKSLICDNIQYFSID